LAIKALAIGDTAPGAVFPEHGEDVVVVVMAAHVHEERRVADHPQRGRGEQGALEAVGRALAHNPARRGRPGDGVIGHRVEEAERVGKYMIRPLLSPERLSLDEKEGKICLELSFVTDKPRPPHIAYQELLMAAEAGSKNF